MEIRHTTEQDREVFVDTIHAAFAMHPPTPAEDGGGVFWAAYEMDRNLLATAEDGRAVGTAGAYSFELTLPGGAIVPTSGVTAVGVLPSHRRRGALTALMREQLTSFRERGECLAVLLAAEAVIYRRFGYGPAYVHGSVDGAAAPGRTGGSPGARRGRGGGARLRRGGAAVAVRRGP